MGALVLDVAVRCDPPLNQARVLDVQAAHVLHAGDTGAVQCVMTLLCTGAQIHLRGPGAELVLEPEQFAIVAGEDGLEIEAAGAAHLFLVRLPLSAIRARGGHGRVMLLGPMPGDSGLGALVRHLLVELCAQQINDEDALMMQETLTTLIAHLVSRHVVAVPGPRTIPARIRRLIESGLADPDLSARTIASALRVSVRSLQRRFDGTGQSFAQWVKQQRLQRCHDDLRNPRWRDLSIASIAWRWGFVDPAHFSRCFRQQYGVCPRNVRQLSRDQR